MRLRRIGLTLLAGAVLGVAQSAHRTMPTGACPGGKASVELDLVSVPHSLDQLIRMSELIVRGTVLRSLPSFNRNPDIVTAIQTNAIVSVSATLHGTAPGGDGTITLAQEGGKTDQCEEIVPSDPLVKVGEEYIFFLLHDDRKQQEMDTSGSARYIVVGVWSGKVKIEKGKVHFLPEANAALHKQDERNVTEFVADLERQISVLLPKRAQ